VIQLSRDGNVTLVQHVAFWKHGRSRPTNQIFVCLTLTQRPKPRGPEIGSARYRIMAKGGAMSYGLPSSSSNHGELCGLLDGAKTGCLSGCLLCVLYSHVYLSHTHTDAIGSGGRPAIPPLTMAYERRECCRVLCFVRFFVVCLFFSRSELHWNSVQLVTLRCGVLGHNAQGWAVEARLVSCHLTTICLMTNC
jgi:hypothetical protein